MSFILVFEIVLCVGYESDLVVSVVEMSVLFKECFGSLGFCLYCVLDGCFFVYVVWLDKNIWESCVGVV